MSPESEKSPEVERRALLSPYMLIQQPNESYDRPTANILQPFVQVTGQAIMASRERSAGDSAHQPEILSPRPRLPASLSTLLNSAEAIAPPPQRGRESPLRSPFRRSSASPRRLTQRGAIADDQRVTRSRTPTRPTLTPQRHSYHTSITRPPHPSRDTFMTFPPNRSRPSTPPFSVEQQRRRRPEQNLPHLSETSIGQALSPLRPGFVRTTSDDRQSASNFQSGNVHYSAEMQRGQTYPGQLSRSNMQMQPSPSQRDQGILIILNQERMPDTRNWSAEEISRYEQGYRDAIAHVTSGQGRAGTNSLNIRIQNPASQEEPFHGGFNSHTGHSANVPPPQVPQLHHQQRRNDQLRIDSHLAQTDVAHRRPSYPSSALPTPAIPSTPHSIVHPPPASDYFSTAFHHPGQPHSAYPPPKRAKRQQISCYPCRNRKLKCDGKKPCAQCSRRHIDGQCKYAENIKRRGRGKKVGDGGRGRGGSEELEPEDEESSQTVQPRYEGSEGQAESSAMAQRRHREYRDEEKSEAGNPPLKQTTSKIFLWTAGWAPGVDLQGLAPQGMKKKVMRTNKDSISVNIECDGEIQFAKSGDCEACTARIVEYGYSSGLGNALNDL
ncbi:uncharacterized protein I303_103596 [Kwoniella dejecticola CBS 10117]|uniref:Zn(2)-C6 fungal-type domain-containing protein n=1 Tax=Kwoniella dejecticola CBS 10117 TaxID=1296121 RepID=A0A1A6A774_9TREE|nr:uncharacterized protein I303_03618 [Kwoniella dejecticola CBS 10117]OBR85903.1 hypothetical protein I303_03618 [Kwoniella dejecticola CBS 10117]